MSRAADKVYEVLVSVGEDGFTSCLERSLRRQQIAELHITKSGDAYTLVEQCRELKPDLLIVSPVLLSDPMIPLFREQVELPELKVISYCTTLLEDKFSKNFDGKILITDTEADLTRLLESMLEIETEPEEQLLTPREQEVVIAVVKGLTNKEIAEELYLSTHTIITHRRNIAKKLNIHSPSGLTIYAIMNKLVELDDIKDI